MKKKKWDREKKRERKAQMTNLEIIIFIEENFSKKKKIERKKKFLLQLEFLFLLSTYMHTRAYRKIMFFTFNKIKKMLISQL